MSMEKKEKEAERCCNGPEKAPDPPMLNYSHDEEFALDDDLDSDCSMDSDDYDDEEDERDKEILKPLKGADNPLTLLKNGQVIIPHYPRPTSPEGCDPAHMCRSQGNVGLQGPRQANGSLIWIGSSLSTMHQVPIHKNLKQTKESYSNVNNVHRSPSVLSKKLMSSRYSSVTVSECGTDMCSICRICQMPGDDRDPLITPCRCAGSLRYVHASCLKVSYCSLYLYIIVHVIFFPNLKYVYIN